jgi:hypothetical protein
MYVTVPSSDDGIIPMLMSNLADKRKRKLSMDCLPKVCALFWVGVGVVACVELRVGVGVSVSGCVYEFVGVGVGVGVGVDF